MAWNVSIPNRMSMYAPMNEQVQRQNTGFANLGSKIGSIAGGMIESSQAESADAQKKAKISGFIQAYNNPNSPEFQGLEGSQRALKLSRLLLPLDAEMSARWEQRAMELEDQGTTAKNRQEEMKIEGRKEIAIEKAKALGKKQDSEIDPTSMEGIKELANQYRSARALMASPNWANLDDAERKNAIREMNSIRETLRETEFGTSLMGDIESTGKEPTPMAEPFDLSAVKGQLNAMSKDVSPVDGLIDNEAEFDSIVEEIVGKSGLGESDPSIKALRVYAESLKSNIAKRFGKKEEKRIEAKTDQQREYQTNKEFLPSIKSVKNLQSNPTDQTNVQLGIAELMKILSGTGVSDKERANTILALTSPEFQAKYRTQGTAFFNSLVAKFINNDQAVINEVSQNADGNRVREQLANRIPKQAFDWYDKTQTRQQRQSTRKVVKDARTFFRK